MTTDNKDSGGLDFQDVVKLVYRWRLFLIIITVVSGIAAFIISSPPITPQKYLASTIFYPATTASLSKSLLMENPGNQVDILTFGEEEETEQVLQLLQSSEIKDYIRDKYNLMEHYDIDSTTKFPNTKFTKEFEENFSFEKTKYLSIRVSVLDTDPKLAAEMANEVVVFVDSLKTKIQRKRAKEALVIVQKEYEVKEKEVSEMIDSLQKLGKIGILNYEEQASVLTQYLAVAKIQERKEAVADFQERLSSLGRFGPVQQALSEKLELELENLDVLKRKFEQAKVDATEELTHIFLVDEAYPPEKKAYPKRMIICLVTMISTFLFALIIFAIIDNRSTIYKSFRS